LLADEFKKNISNGDPGNKKNITEEELIEKINRYVFMIGSWPGIFCRKSSPKYGITATALIRVNHLKLICIVSPII